MFINIYTSQATPRLSTVEVTLDETQHLISDFFIQHAREEIEVQYSPDSLRLLAPRSDRGLLVCVNDHLPELKRFAWQFMQVNKPIKTDHPRTLTYLVNADDESIAA